MSRYSMWCNGCDRDFYVTAEDLDAWDVDGLNCSRCESSDVEMN